MLKALHKHFSVTVDGANGQKKKATNNLPRVHTWLSELHQEIGLS